MSVDDDWNHIADDEVDQIFAALHSAHFQEWDSGCFDGIDFFQRDDLLRQSVLCERSQIASILIPYVH